VNKHKQNRKRLNDEIRDIAAKPIVKKPKKIDTMSIIKEDYVRKSKSHTSTSQNGSSSREKPKSPSKSRTEKSDSAAESKSQKKTNGSSSLSDIEREKLREKVRQISMKLGNTSNGVDKKSKEHHHKKKKKKKHKKKYAKFEGERVSHLDKTDVFKGQPNLKKKKKSRVMTTFFQDYSKNQVYTQP